MAERDIDQTVKVDCYPPAANHSRHSLVTDLGEGERVRGRYRIWQTRQGRRYDGETYWRIELTDRTGRLTTYLWPDGPANALPLIPGSVVEVEFTTRRFDGLVADIRSIDSVEGIEWHEVIDLLPRPACPSPASLDALAEIVGSLDSVPLRRFVGDVLGEKEIGAAFLAAPASLGAHHGWSGGLLEHSVEAARTVLDWRDPDRHVIEIGAVAALLHDIGKVMTFTPAVRQTDLGRLVRHEHLTLELCGPALKTLEVVWPDAALLLRHIWTSGLDHRGGNLVAHPIAEIVALADRLSAAQSSRALAFAAAPDHWSCVRRDGRLHWRIGGRGQEA